MYCMYCICMCYVHTEVSLHLSQLQLPMQYRLVDLEQHLFKCAYFLRCCYCVQFQFLFLFRGRILPHFLIRFLNIRKPMYTIYMLKIILAVINEKKFIIIYDTGPVSNSDLPNFSSILFDE